jgi:hypothetical protein
MPPDAAQLAVAPEPAPRRLIESFDVRRAGPVNLHVGRLALTMELNKLASWPLAALYLIAAWAWPPNASAPQFDHTCGWRSLEIRLVDPQGDVIVGSRVVLVPSDDTADPKAPVAAALDQGDGTYRFTCVPFGRYELVSTTPGFPTKRVRLSVDTPREAHRLELVAGIPCDGEVGPPVILNERDRVEILTDLLRHAQGYPELSVLLDENIDSLRRSRSVPAHLVVLSEKALLRRSRTRSINYIAISAVEIKGSCVVASYSISCAESGHLCTLCCESKTYTYRRVGERWQGTYFWGGTS